MDPIRALIVDDEPLARERIAALLAPDPEVDIAGTCVDGVAAVDAIRDLAPDLVFLDVQMPEVDGFEVVARIGVDRMPVVVFVTAFDRHALKAFDAHALDYLLKPFDEDRFREALSRAKSAIRAARAADLEERMRALLAERDAADRPLDRLVVKESGRLVFVRVDEVDWIEADGNYVRLHCGAASHMLREALGALESRLDPNRFVRIHRSTVVNLDRIREIQPLFHGEYRVVLEDGTRLTLSRGYRDRLTRFGG